MTLIRALLPLFVASSLAAQPTWTLSPKATIEIGDEANTQTQFNGVSGILRMPSGEIVVANARSQELRVFSPTGEYIRTLSRSGRGPGEMRFMGGIWRAGDTIFVSEFQPGESNLHAFTTRAFVSKTVLRSGPGGTTPLARFPDGRLLVSPAGFTILGEPPVGTIVDDTLRLGAATIRDTAPIWIGEFLSKQTYLIDSPFRPGHPFPVGYSFGRRLGYAVSGDLAWIGNSQDGLIGLYNSAGKKVGQIKLPLEQRPLNAEVIRRLRNTLPAQAANRVERARIEGLYSAPLPKGAPLFSGFLPGVNGEMWVALYNEDPEVSTSYVVVDRTGRAIGRITMPRGFAPFEVGADYLLGVLKDEDGLEHIVQYTVRRR